MTDPAALLKGIEKFTDVDGSLEKLLTKDGWAPEVVSLLAAAPAMARELIETRNTLRQAEEAMAYQNHYHPDDTVGLIVLALEEARHMLQPSQSTREKAGEQEDREPQAGKTSVKLERAPASSRVDTHSWNDGCDRDEYSNTHP